MYRLLSYMLIVVCTIVTTSVYATGDILPAVSDITPVSIDTTRTGAFVDLSRDDYADIADFRATMVYSGSVYLEWENIKIDIPPGYAYLDKKMARYVLEDIWENLPDDTVGGMLVPADFPVGDADWGIVVTYRNSGYIADDEAAKIDADVLLKDIQNTQADTNKSLQAQYGSGYEWDIVGWAVPPRYDSNTKKLYWAVKQKFAGETEPTGLNYSLRVLGRYGYIQIEWIGGMNRLLRIQAETQKIIKSINFTPGNTYAEYDSATDTAAAYGIAGLIGGAILAQKTGLWVAAMAIFAKFGKLIVIGVLVIAAGIWSWVKSRGEKK